MGMGGSPHLRSTAFANTPLNTNTAKNEAPSLLMSLAMVARYSPRHQPHSTIGSSTQVDHSSVPRENRMALTCDRSAVDSDTEA
jgi:hypothetical protein